AVNRVVAQHEGVERARAALEVAKVALERGPVVGAHHQVAHQAARLQALRRVDERRSRRAVPHAEQQEVEPGEAGAPQRDLDRRRQERRDARVRLHRHHHPVAIAPRDAADRPAERRAAQRSPVEIVDALIDGLLDHAFVAGEAAADAEPRGEEARLAEGDRSAEIGHVIPPVRRDPIILPWNTRSRKRYLRPRSPLTRRAPGCDSRPCETPVNQFDPLDPEVISDPYPWYRWLLREAPVYHDEANALWVLSRYDDVLAAARAPAALSSQQGVAYRRLGLPMMISMDPPGHTRLRSIVSREFTPKSLERWRQIVERLAREAVDRLLDGETSDFVAAVASPFPVAVIAEILGVPRGDLPLLRRVSDDFIEGFKIGQEQSRVAGLFMDLMSRPRVVGSISSIGMRRPLAMRTFLAVVAAVVRTVEGRGGRWFDDLNRVPRAVADLQAYCVDLVRERQRRPTEDLPSK